MSKYYTNGINEKRFNDNDSIPEGWYPGRLKSPITTLNKSWYNNGTKEMFLNNDSVIPDGFVKGRICNQERIDKRTNTINSKHFRHYHNGIKEILVAEKDEIPIGYVKGRLPMSKEQKEKLSLAHKGKHHTQETKNKISQHSNNNRPKARQTNLVKYGKEYYNNRDKELETKKKNNSLNTSKPEIAYYNMLCEIYGKHNVKRNYKSNEYPYRCDFYIVSENRYIELNLHWTHGGHPFDNNCEDDLKILSVWQEKAKISQFYRNAITVWTIRDVEKQRIAKENKLDYEVIYKI